MDLPDRKYNVIYADPPWDFGSKYGKDMKNIDDHYDIMSMEQIKDMKVENITKDKCILFMWCPDAHLKYGIEVIESWGFKYKTVAFNWLKRTKNGSYCYNVGPYTLKSWELCLLGTKGAVTSLLDKRNIKGLVHAIRREHSRKPEEVQKRIDKMMKPVPKIELFAREEKEGWDVWGNEVGKFDTDFTEEEKTQTKLFDVGG